MAKKGILKYIGIQRIKKINWIHKQKHGKGKEKSKKAKKVNYKKQNTRTK